MENSVAQTEPVVAATTTTSRKRSKRPPTHLNEVSVGPSGPASAERAPPVSAIQAQKKRETDLNSAIVKNAAATIHHLPQDTVSPREVKKRKRKSSAGNKESSARSEDGIPPCMAINTDNKQQTQQQTKKQRKESSTAVENSVKSNVVLPSKTTPNKSSAENSFSGQQTPPSQNSAKKVGSVSKSSTIALAEYRRLHPELKTSSPVSRLAVKAPSPVVTAATSIPTSSAVSATFTENPPAVEKAVPVTPSSLLREVTPSSNTKSKAQRRVTEHSPHPLPVHSISSPPSVPTATFSNPVSPPSAPVVLPTSVPAAAPAAPITEPSSKATPARPVNKAAISPRLVRLPSSSPEVYPSSESEGEKEYDRRVKLQGPRRSPGSDDLQAIGDDDISDAESGNDPLATPTPFHVTAVEPSVRSAGGVSEAEDDCTRETEVGHLGDSLPVDTQDDIAQSPHSQELPSSIEPISEDQSTGETGSRQGLGRQTFRDIEAFASSGAVPHNSGAAAYFEALGDDDDDMCRTSSRAASESLRQDRAVSAFTEAVATPGAAGPAVLSTPLRPSSGDGPNSPSLSRPPRPLDIMSQPSPTPKTRRRMSVVCEIPVTRPTTGASQLDRGEDDPSLVAEMMHSQVSERSGDSKVELPDAKCTTCPCPQSLHTSMKIRQLQRQAGDSDISRSAYSDVDELAPSQPPNAALENFPLQPGVSDEELNGAESGHLIAMVPESVSAMRRTQAKGECCDICLAVPPHLQRKCPIIIGGLRSVVDRLEELQKDGSSPRGIESLKVWEAKLKRHTVARSDLAHLRNREDEADANADSPDLLSKDQTASQLSATNLLVAEVPAQEFEGLKEVITTDEMFVDPGLPEEQHIALGIELNSDSSQETDEDSSADYDTDVEREDTGVSFMGLNSARSPNDTMLRKSLLNGNTAIPSLSSLSADSLRRRRSQGSLAGSVTGRSSVGGRSRHGSESVAGDAGSAAILTSESDGDGDGASTEDSSDEDSDDDALQGNGRLDPSIEARMIKPGQKKKSLKTKGQLTGW
jgi:hypothetical protein